MKKLLLLSSCLVLAACQTEPEDLVTWIGSTQKEAKSTVRTSELPSVPVMQSYTPPTQPALDAFNSKRLSGNQQGKNAPNLNRPKEILENYSLANLKYVGSLRSNNNVSAFVEAEGHVYTVAVGNFIGQSYGQISGIFEDHISITELVEDAQGNWIFRKAELPLNGTAAPESKN